MTSNNPSLLLLPAPPSDHSEDAFEAAYKPSIASVLRSASQRPNAALDIAVLCSNTQDASSKSRNQKFHFYQSILAGVYNLCCRICVELGIDPVKPGYVNYRVLLIDHDDKVSVSQSIRLSQGPLFSLQTLAAAERAWSVIYSTESETGEAFLSKFVTMRRSNAVKSELRSFVTEKVPGGTSIKVLRSNKDWSGVQPRQNRTVAVGGTFDNLHEGHKLLLSCTALALEPPRGEDPSPRRLIIGITGDQLLVNKKYAEMLESWDDRQEASFRFVRDIVCLQGLDSSLVKTETRNDPGPNGKAKVYHLRGNLTVECVEIQDPFGPTITDEAVDSLVVSAETRSGGKAVNDKRAEKGWQALEVFEVDVLGPSGSTDLQDKISSTEKRKRRLEAQGGKL